MFRLVLDLPARLTASWPDRTLGVVEIQSQSPESAIPVKNPTPIKIHS